MNERSSNRFPEKVSQINLRRPGDDVGVLPGRTARQAQE